MWTIQYCFLWHPADLSIYGDPRADWCCQLFTTSPTMHSPGPQTHLPDHLQILGYERWANVWQWSAIKWLTCHYSIIPQRISFPQHKWRTLKHHQESAHYQLTILLAPYGSRYKRLYKVMYHLYQAQTHPTGRTHHQPWSPQCYWVVELCRIFMASHIILTCKMPDDTPNSITGHTDLLLSGEMSMHQI